MDPAVGVLELDENCTLKLQTSRMKIHLEGDSDFVRTAYEALRKEILVRLTSPPEPSGLDRADVADTQKIVTKPAAEPMAGEDCLWVYFCNDLYNKVHVSQREKITESELGAFVNPWRLTKVYVESGTTEPIRALVPVGKTLWSELTTTGRERLRKD